ncbi:MAG: hypothetical protein IKD73_08150 [Selenomonadaceae bacterium]|nr:hypothetical protein [Selenomonadaceae bacterium]
MLIDVKHFSRNVPFVVADTDPQYTPRTFEELKQCCDDIKREIPAKGNNKVFVEKLFTFFKDCGLITLANVAFLNDSFSCRKEFYYPMNPVGGILRKKGLSMGSPGKYYKKRAVVCEHEIYYISNYWYDNATNTNKAEFYNWVVNKALVKLDVPQNLQARGLLYIPYH